MARDAVIFPEVVTVAQTLLDPVLQDLVGTESHDAGGADPHRG